MFTFQTLAVWWGEAIFHSLVFFIGASLLSGPHGIQGKGGLTPDLTIFGNMVMSAAVVTVIFKWAIEIKYCACLLPAVALTHLAIQLLDTLARSMCHLLLPVLSSDARHRGYHLASAAGRHP
jgi:hypothetical protein